MDAKLIKVFLDLRASYWLIPACMVVVAIGLSALMPWLDANYEADWIRSFEWLTAARTDGARSVLTVIAGSTIGVAGVTFSITIVAVSFASANFGPRLIANFMRDRGNQITLGTFIGTYVYCLLVLRTVRNASEPDIENSFQAFVPHFSVLVALLLALSSVAVLIYFIHHVPETLNVENLVAKVGRQLRRGISELFPDSGDADMGELTDEVWESRRQEMNHAGIGSRSEGYVQTLDLGRLTELADENELLVRVQYRPGDFITRGSVVFDIWSEKPLSGSVEDALLACFALGNERTAHQNVLFLADQLVEIIGRALSPGINDPFTAITCLNWLKVGVLQMLQRDISELDPPKHGRLRVYPITLERFASAVFDQTLPYVCTDRNATLHCMAILTELACATQVFESRQILVNHLSRLASAADGQIPANAGGRDVSARYQEAMKILADPDTLEAFRQSPGWFGGRA